MFYSTAPLDKLVATLASFPLAFQPGSAWRYSYANDVLASLVEVVTQKPFDQFLSERIFQPLAMEDTGFFVPPEKWERLATLYTKSEEGKWITIERAGEGRYSHAHNYISGGSGLVGTAADYMRFCQMLLNSGMYDGQRILSQKAVELMMKNHLPSDSLPMQVGEVKINGYGYGYSMRVLLNPVEAGTLASAGECGWSRVTHTYFWIDPHQDLIGIFMTQYLPPFTHTTHWVFRELLYQAIDR